MRQNKMNMKGFSLLELLLVVAVGAILILAGLAIYRNVTSQSQVNEASRLINVLKQETQKIWQGQATYGPTSSDLNAVLINANAVPNSYIIGTTINSPFDTAVNVISQGNTFDVVITDVPRGPCINLGTLYNANDPDFAQVDIGGTAITAPTVGNVNTACSNSPPNTMTWSFN
jgi:prepilin-type N-terminal cleavage/methylation domain-containing protein